jgi:hypothetical protein
MRLASSYALGDVLGDVLKGLQSAASDSGHATPKSMIHAARTPCDVDLLTLADTSGVRSPVGIRLQEARRGVGIDVERAALRYRP